MELGPNADLNDILNELKMVNVGSKTRSLGQILEATYSVQSSGCRQATLCHGPLSVMRPSVRALTFS